MKIYKTELPDPVELEDLVLGGVAVPDPDVEPPEVEWQLLQSPPLGKVGAWEDSENGGDEEVGVGNDVVSRRYEFYKYVGQYDPDPENFREALCDNPTALDQQLPASPRCGAPDANGIAGVGDLIGAQNAAVNLVPACATDAGDSVAVVRSGYAFNFTTKLFSQKLTLTNTSQVTLFGPISLALDNLSGNASMYLSSGTTLCTFPQNSSYVDTRINTSVAGLAPGASVSLVLQFVNPTKSRISYSTRVLTTSGMR